MDTKFTTKTIKELLLMPIHYMKRSAHQENIIILNVYVPNGLKCVKQKLIILQE